MNTKAHPANPRRDARFLYRVERNFAKTTPVAMDGSVGRVVRAWLDSLAALGNELDEQAGADLDAALAGAEPEDIAYILGRDGRYEITVTLDPDTGPTSFTLIDTHHAPF